ncbi:hypothetical protein A4X09_0g4018 [Tilletia walkeri]|uniref:Uncharacterized protein n=1 Tax=Tilletia walkeri TaxID=117179 RepID=A0A8X7T4A0_9BASI|nr:hypothetical protein A4X09_0g4018 [Tilletia walkeri]
MRTSALQRGPSTPISAQALQPTTFTTPDPSGTSPLDRFQTLNVHDRRRVHRAMNKIGIQVQESMGGGDDTGGNGQKEDLDDDAGTYSADNQVNNLEATTEERPFGTIPDRTSAPLKDEETLPTASASNTRPSQPLVCKQEFLGTYSGDPSRLEAFLSRVRDVIRSHWKSPTSAAWTSAVLRALPIALRDNAAVWHDGLSDTEAANLTSSESWASMMRSAFPINEIRQRREARERKWNPSKELVAAYYFQKIRLLRQAYGSEQKEDALVTDIRDGFPTTFITMLRLPRQNPSLQALRDEMS